MATTKQSADSAPRERQARLLAKKFFEFRGSPDRYNNNETYDEWTAQFVSLLDRCSYETLGGLIDWAARDGFWPKALLRPKNIAEKLDQLLDQYEGHQIATKNAAAAEQKDTSHLPLGHSYQSKANPKIVYGKDKKGRAISWAEFPPCEVEGCGKGPNEHLPRFTTTHG